MAPLTLFHLERCPYCIEARTYLNELIQEDPRYAAVTIELIEERQNKALADAHDYYLVPTFYLGSTKLFEGIMTKADVRNVLEAALAAK
jgi:glutaredoxin